jgi:hypothetical protein
LDEYLSFNKHVSHICAKITRSIFCIKRAANFLSLKSLKSLYYAMIHPHLLYCINLFVYFFIFFKYFFIDFSIFNIHTYFFTYIHLHSLNSLCVSSSHVPLSAVRPPCGSQVGNRTWDYRTAVRRASNLATPHPSI